MEEFGTTNLIFMWDSPTSLRRDKYPFYKEGRKKKQKVDPDLPNMRRQMVELKTILPALGFNAHVEVDGYEADDTMCEMVRRYPHTSFHIVANDNDLLQILRYKNLKSLFSCRENKRTTYLDFVTIYGIKPDDWHFFKALGGCASDEVPGIPGIGKTYALRFIKGELPEDSAAYQTIYEHRTTTFIRNHWLVTLPLPGLKDVKFRIMKNKLSKKKAKLVHEVFGVWFTADWNRWFK
jgi:5'-3' exonuclease